MRPASGQEGEPHAIGDSAGELEISREATPTPVKPQHREPRSLAAQGAAPDRWIADIPKNSREVMRVQLQTFKGYELCSVRVWYRERDDEALRPGKNGLTLRVEKLLDLRDAIDKAIDAAKGEGSL